MLRSRRYIIKKIGRINAEAEIKESLKEKRPPLKLFYIADGADSWDDLRGTGHATAFELGNRELLSIKRLLKEVPGFRDPTNIVHFGIGNGIEIPAIFSSFDFKKHAYVGVDISKSLIEKAMDYQEKVLGRCDNVTFFESDVEKEGNIVKICSEIKQKFNPQNLLIFSGEGTLLSNLEVFRFVSDALGKGDLAIFSLEGYDKRRSKEMLSTYDQQKFRKFCRNGLKRAGITEGKFLKAQFNPSKSRAEVYFQKANDEKILCLASYKPSSIDELKKVLLQSGLQPSFIRYSEEDRMYRVLCKKE